MKLMRIYSRSQNFKLIFEYVFLEKACRTYTHDSYNGVYINGSIIPFTPKVADFVKTIF